MINYVLGIQSVILKFGLDLYGDNSLNCIETAAFIKIKLKTHGMIKDIMKYENEFKNVLGDNIWLESKSGYVNICMPKDKTDIYPLTEIIESDFYIGYQSPLKFAIGENIDGAMALGDLSKMINVLISGTPDSGKSSLLNVMINCFIQQPTEVLNLVLMDLKRVELKRYNHIPHLLKPVITDVESAEDCLISLISEMKRRYTILEENGCRNIQTFNKNNKMPYIVTIIDELSTLMLSDNKKECEKQLVFLASMGRACGIHLILATQKSTANVITTLIKSNIDTRISFHVASESDSRVILDQSGAEKLRMGGDMILRDRDGTERIQCCYISGDEIDISIERNSRQFEKVEIIQEQLDYIDAEFEEVEKEYLNESERLFKEAISFIEDTGKCNLWALKSYLKVGNRKANEIIESLQKEGIISECKVGNNYIIKGDL